MVIENKAREAERIVSQLVDEAERRKEEARELQREVASARYVSNLYHIIKPKNSMQVISKVFNLKSLFILLRLQRFGKTRQK